MGLSDDQKALLRLLAQREQGYEDIAALLGLSVEEVRERVKDALAAVEGEESAAASPAPPPAPPAADPEPAPASPPAAPSTASAQAPTQPPRAARQRPAKQAGQRATKLPKERRVLAIGGGLAAVVLVVVLLATGVIGGSGSSSGSDSPSASDNGDAGAQTVAQLQRELARSNLTGAILAPPAGGDAKGTVIFGRRGKQVLMNIEATGLETSPAGSSYAVWLYKSPRVALRVGAIKVAEKDNGGIAAQLPIPTQLLTYVAGGVFDQISLTLTSDAAYRAAVRKARQAKDELPAYTGETVLRGPIKGPMVQAGKANQK